MHCALSCILGIDEELIGRIATESRKVYRGHRISSQAVCHFTNSRRRGSSNEFLPG
ncbi:hypothetical protein Rhal01_03782 [Rubritalea halochordaticola]|uniref:Uncharacterized protein n=1 Tax=Rubritalea halochordaticola TaxID=714537 RepID=A0ABP9V951_9BACT